MTYWNLARMNILRIFFLSIFLFIFNLQIISQDLILYYRSNSNGLKLVQINSNQIKNYKYTLQVFSRGNIDNRKILFKDNKEIKRWEYYYKSGYLNYEKYFSDNIIKEDYIYDLAGHLLKKGDFKDNNKIKETTYTYNKDGLVDIEKVMNLLNNTSFIIKYRYDNAFRIKQIEKKYSDDRLVYWEAFFNDKGIIQKEYYILENEKYTFWYNENGQEIKGEILLLDREDDNIKKAWKTYYSKSGNLDRKEEINYILEREIKTWFNKKNKELKKEIYIKGNLEKIEAFDYDSKSRLAYYELIEDLKSTKYLYKYDDSDNLIRTQHYENNILKKDISYNIKDQTRTEIFFSKNNKKIMIKYDKNEKVISQELIK